MPQYIQGGAPVGGPIENQGYVTGGHPVVSWTPADDDRVRKHGGIKAEPKKSFWDKTLDFAAELVPYHQYMTESGRMLMAAENQEARAQKNFLEFTKLLDWTVGGDTAIAFFGKRLLKNAEKNTVKNVVENLEKNVPTPETPPTAIQKAEQANQREINKVFFRENNQDIIDKTFRDETKHSLPTRHTYPQDRVGVLQRANQRIINATQSDAEAVLQKKLEVPSKQPEGAKKTLEAARASRASANVTETSRTLRSAKRLTTGEHKPFHRAETLIDEKDIGYFYSGYPVGEGLKNLVDAGRQLLDKFWWKPDVAQDVKWWQEMASLPHWLAKKFPQAKKLYQIQMARQDARSEIYHAFLEGVDDFIRLKGDDYNTAKKLLLLGDKEGRVFTKEELLKAGASEKVVRAYYGVRRTLDDIQNDYWQRMVASGIPEDEIMQLRKQLGNIQGYFPRTRHGKYFIKAQKEGASPQRIHFNNGFQGKKIKDNLQKDGFQIIESGSVNKLPEEVYFQISPQAISQVVDVATEGFDSAIKKELRKNIADVFKERGWAQHGISRQDFIGGFETDNLKEVLHNYISGYSGFVTKMDAAKQFRKTLTQMAFGGEESGKLGAKETPGLFRWANKYVTDVMENADKFDEISGKIRAAAFFKYLGGVVKSGAVNLTQNFIGAAPRLSLETKWAYKKLSQAMADIVTHSRAAQKMGGKALEEEEAKALRIALQRGWTREQYQKELMGQLGKYGSVPQKIQNIAGGPMAISERFNRQSTFLAAFRVFRKEKKLAFNEAIEKAAEVVEDSHFVYGKGNLPGVFRGTKAGKIARTGYTFRTFTHNYINLLAYMGKRDPKAVAKSLAAIGTIGGVSALPFFKTVESIAQRYGYQPRSYIKEKLTEYGLGNKTELALYGLPSILDIDVGGSIGIEAPGQRSLTSSDPKAMVLEGATDVMGVPFSFMEDTMKSSQHLYNGDIYRAIEDSPITPIVVSNAMKAKRLATEGQTTLSGKPVLDDSGQPVKLSKRQAIQKGIFGFQTPEQTENYRKYQARKSEIQRWERKRDSLVTNFARMVRRYGYGSDEADSVMEKITQYNKSLPFYASAITTETLKNRLIKKQSKKDVLIQQAIP